MDVLPGWMSCQHRDSSQSANSSKGATVVLRSDEANSHFTAAELMSAWAFERYTRMTFNNYDEVPWGSVEKRLGQPCSG
ncbi:MAG: hypothetical protein AAF653_11910, partial [Chloroflexota bacterium]